MIISKNKFLSYQRLFYRKLMGVPYKIQLEFSKVIQVPTTGFSLDSFVGDSPREPEIIEINALYEKEISTRVRDKFGLSREVNGVVYISPLQLIPKIGTFNLDWNKTKVHFEGRIQVIEKIVYLEQLYDSCVGIQIFVKDAIKGG